MNTLEAFSKKFTPLFPVWIVLISVFAYFQPALFTSQAKMVPYLLGTVMLCMGLTLTPKDFRLVLSQPKDVFFGVVLRYLTMPLLAFVIAKLFNMPPELAAGMILLGACPSATTANILTFIARGDMALSVTVTSINTMISPFFTPYIFMLLAGTLIPIQAEAMFLDILKVVLTPIALGVALRYFFSSAVAHLIRIVPLISVLSVVLIVGIVVGASADKLLSVAFIMFLAVALFNIAGLSVGFFGAKSLGMSNEKSKAVAFEIGVINSGLCAALAMTHLGPIAAIPAVIFSFWATFSGSIFASFWASRSR